MRITWWHDFKLEEYIGGAEITDYYFMQTLRNHIVTECNRNDRLVPADLTIIGNHAFLKEQPKGEYYVIMHGYHNEGQDELYKNAKKIIYGSPKRQSAYGLSNSTCIAPFVDGSVFRYRNKWRPKKRSGNLYIGRIHPLKGLDNMIDWAKANKEEIDLYGYGSEQDLKKIEDCEYTEYKGIVNQKQVVDLMNEYERFVFLPNEKESFGRTIVEAHLCEMEVFTNPKRVGAYSWDWDFNNRDDIQDRLFEQLDNFKELINGTR